MRKKRSDLVGEDQRTVSLELRGFQVKDRGGFKEKIRPEADKAA